MAYPDPPTTPPIPQRGDRTTFSDRVDAFLTWVAAIIPWLQGFVNYFLSNLSAFSAGGANTFSYNFDSAVTNTDPGPGFLNLNGPMQDSSTALRIDPIADGGVDINAVLLNLISSTNAAKGSIKIQVLNRPDAWLLFDITGFTPRTGYYDLVVSYVAGTSQNPFINGDKLIVFIERNGNKGDSGTIGYIKVSDKKAATTTGGAAVSGLQDRTLNTLDLNEISGASLSASSVTLPAGSYEVYARTPAAVVAGCRSVLFNVTDGVAVLYGGSDYTEAGSSANCMLNGKFTITSAKSFKLQTYAQNSNNNGGLGQPARQAGQMEIYSELIFRKIT